jgi:hypothetical protein
LLLNSKGAAFGLRLFWSSSSRIAGWVGGMGHGCTNYGGFGEKELEGIGVSLGLDSKIGAGNRGGIDHTKMRKTRQEGSVRQWNGPTQAKTGLEWATRQRSGCNIVFNFSLPG